MPDDLDHDAILREAVTGRSVRNIAKARGMTMPELNRVLVLEAERLRRPSMSAAVYVKCSERLASMVGMNHPHGHLVTISGSLVPIEHETSTEKLAEVIRQLKADGQAKP